jgi:amino acid adenylation domain-containing protein/non-ribosomal peptide synthase protein (TIGR01720 family)
VTDLANLLEELRRTRVRIWAEGETLRYRGSLTPELLAALRDRRADLLALCRQVQPGVTEPDMIAAPADAPPEISLAQRRLWLLQQMNGADPAYNIALALRLRGDLNVIALRQGLEVLLRRHEGLRTGFISQDEHVRPLVVENCPLPYSETDLSLLPPQRRMAQVEQEVRAAALRPFDLAEAPLVRFGLWRLDRADHVLLLNMHHIIADARSVEILAEELAVLYRSHCLGLDATLPALEIRYSDFAWRQRRQMPDAVLQQQLEYWRRQLADLPPLLEVPADRRRPAIFSSAGASVCASLDAMLVERLKQLARDSGSTLHTVLLAGFAALLARYTDRDDIPIACAATHRTPPLLDRLVGFFVNSLALRIDLAGNPGFTEIVRRTHRVVTQAFIHQDVPFDMVVEALDVPRNPSYPPLTQVSMTLLSAERARLQLHGLETEPFDYGGSLARHDLALEIYEARGSLDIYWVYATSRFDAATVQRMARHLRTLLGAVAARPEVTLSALPLMDDAELRLITQAWSVTPAEPPPISFVHRLIEMQAQRSPEAVALVMDDRALRYGELNAAANRLARRLVAEGVGPGARVGICLARSFELVTAVLAVLKAGAAYVPLDPAHPGSRRAAMLDDAGAIVLLTDGSWADAPANRTVIRPDTAQHGRWVDDDSDLQTVIAPDDLAYVIYTSGSTGRPKGCQIEHRNLMHYLHWADRRVHGSDPDTGGCYGLFTSVAFDLTVTNLFLPLLRGRTLRIFPQDAALSDILHDYFDPASGLDAIKLTPSHLSLLPPPAARPTGVSVAIVGGEQLLPEQVTSLRRLNPEMRVYNEYGPTETTVGATIKEVRPEDTTIVIGRPIDNTTVYVLDRHLQPQVIGVAGELCIGGGGVGRGYLNQPELTARSFIPDPFSAEPGARLYRTGDLARWTPAGELECLGRLDHQVKIRGFRIELSEIEAVLAHHPAVLQVAVLAIERDPPGRSLAAFIATGSSGLLAGADDAEFRRFLSERLPAHMVPAAFVVLEALPLTLNGKIDHDALGRSALPEASPAAIHVPPRNDAERLLAEIWTQVLRRDRIGVHDDFFRLGGDSILGIIAVARANQRGLCLTPTLLLHNPTIAGLAAVATTAVPVRPSRPARPGPIPLLPIQRWWFAQDSPEPHHYNQALLLNLTRPMQHDFLVQTARTLLDHHDALRLRFRNGAAGWTQEISPPQPEARIVTWYDLSMLDPDRLRDRIEAEAAKLQTSLDLERSLIAIGYFDCGLQQPARLLWIVHHLAVDGVSWRILLDDLWTAYQQLESGAPPQLPAVTTSWLAWADRLAEHAKSANLSRELDYWTGEVATAPRLPVDLTEGANDEASSRIVEVALTRAETEALLQEALPALGVRIREVLLGALAHGLLGWVGPGAIPVDLEGHGREAIFEDVDLTRTVGWFTTIAPFLLPLQPTDDWPVTLRVLQTQLHRMPNGGIGYGLLRYLRDDAAIEQRLAAMPHAEICFNYLGQFTAVGQGGPAEPALFQIARESPGASLSPRGNRRHLLRFDGEIDNGRLQFRLQYSENRHHRATMLGVGNGFIEALRAMLRARPTRYQKAGAAEFRPSSLDRREIDKVARLLQARRPSSGQASQA